MGVDSTAMCMVGKWFEDFDAALDFLLQRGFIDEKVVEESKDYGDLRSDLPIRYQEISFYSKEGGYLGIDVPSSVNMKRLEEYVDQVQQIIGKDDEVGFHSFTHWW